MAKIFRDAGAEKQLEDFLKNLREGANGFLVVCTLRGVVDDEKIAREIFRVQEKHRAGNAPNERVRSWIKP